MDRSMNTLLDNIISAHGGLERWGELRAIDVDLNFYGGLLDLKGFPGHHRPRLTVDVSEPPVLQGLGGDPDDRWVFTPAKVWIERRDGSIVEARSDPRASFAGHVRETPWDRLHLTWPAFLPAPGAPARRSARPFTERSALQAASPQNRLRGATMWHVACRADDASSLSYISRLKCSELTRYRMSSNCG
jgi:hypothetical protein